MAYENSEFLVETEWLESHLMDEDLRLIEVTGVLSANGQNAAKEMCYDRHHIPGAVFLDVASHRGVFSDPKGKFPLTWPTLGQFEDLMGNLGVSNNTRVVLYASSVGQRLYSCAMWCTRAWWIMHNFGVRCAILNGSLERWIDEGRPSTTETGHYTATRFKADRQWARAIAYKEDVLEALQGDNSQCVVNALPRESYLGASDIVYGTRKGHITGSVSVPMPNLVDWDSGVFVSAQEMRKQFERADVLSAESVVTYCGGGGCATTNAFALALLGFTRVKMYDNSLYEWGADPTLPMTNPSDGNGVLA
jgi:thiosulfate/3-mercaptopyruvate sulfurtransferase